MPTLRNLLGAPELDPGPAGVPPSGGVPAWCLEAGNSCKDKALGYLERIQNPLLLNENLGCCSKS